jgi:hypothetical protein
MVLALLAALASLFVVGLAWVWALRQLGVNGAQGHVLRAWFSGNLCKYVPGQIWMPVGRTVLAARAGVPVRAAVVTTAIEQIFSVLAAALLLTGGLRSVRLGGLVAAISLVLTHPRVTNAALRLLDQALHRPLALSPLRAWQLLTLYLVSWLSLGLGFLTLVSVMWSLGVFDASQTRLYLVAMTGSFLSGYFFVGAPAGLGVREGVLLLSLSRAGLTEGEGSAVAVLTRLVTAVADVASFALVSAVLNWHRRGNEPLP